MADRTTIRRFGGWLIPAGLGLAAVLAAVTVRGWWPPTQTWVRGTLTGLGSDQQSRGRAADAHDHSGHDHGGHDSGQASLELSDQALGNIGLTREYLRPVELQTFRRAITVPAMVVEKPGRTRIEVSTPMAGVITHVHAVQGEAIPAGSLLFEIRITAEELVSTQTALLRTLGELDVERREIARLESVTRSGAVAQKTLLEREYTKDKLDVLLAAQKEALRLQGLSERQILEIVESRRLLRTLQIVAPTPDEHSHEELRLTLAGLEPVAYGGAAEDAPGQDAPGQAAVASDGPGLARSPGSEPPAAASPSSPPVPGQTPPQPRGKYPPLLLQEVLVHKGESVPAGATLAVVADLSELYVEGRAFEQDVELLATAAGRNWPVTALFERAGRRLEQVGELELLYSASSVDVDSRTLRFYVRLPNQILRNVPSSNGLSYVEWRFRPGQRLQLRVPVDEWERQIVLPVEAVAQEGAETYVFRQNGGHFDRIPVRVVYRDQTQVVIKNDGSIFPGEIVAGRGAHQMQMALRNRSGGAVDPHAGHSH